VIGPFLLTALLASNVSPATSCFDALPLADRVAIATHLIEKTPATRFIAFEDEGLRPHLADRLGAEAIAVAKRDDELGYVKFSVPSEKALATLCDHRTLGLIQVDSNLSGPETYLSLDVKAEVPARLPSAAVLHAITPFAAIDALGFRARHPSGDGRGIAVLTPELVDPTAAQFAGANGSRVSILPQADPGSTRAWFPLAPATLDQAGHIAAGESRLIVPDVGPYALGRYESADVKLFVVLDASGGLTLFVNAAGEQWPLGAAADYRLTRMMYPDSLLGLGDGGNFAVATTTDRKFARLYRFRVATHGTAVMSSAFGGAYYGSVDSLAPQIRVLSGAVPFGSEGDSASTLIEDMSAATSAHRIDLISLSLGSGNVVGGWHDALSEFFDRLTRRRNVAIVAAMGNNGPQENILTPSSGRDVLAIGAMRPRDNLAVFTGEMPATDMIAAFSNRGLLGDGRQKPDVIAPTNMLATLPFGAANDVAQFKRFRSSFLPGQYTISGGTSTAGPVAAGALSMLLSAARAERLRAEPWRVRLAVLSTARPLPDADLVGQGAGVVQVAHAFAMLRRLQALKRPANAELGGYWLKADEIVFGRETRRRWTREIDLSGWGALAAAATVRVDSPRRDVRIVRLVRKGRLFSVALEAVRSAATVSDSALVAGDRSGIVFRRATIRLIAPADFALQKQPFVSSGILTLEQTRIIIVRVPPGASALHARLRLDLKHAGMARNDRHWAYYDSVLRLKPYHKRDDGHRGRNHTAFIDGEASEVIEMPEPGLWEIDLMNWDLGEPLGPLTYRLEISAYGFEQRATAFEPKFVSVANLAESTFAGTEPPRDWHAAGGLVYENFDVPAETRAITATFDRSIARDTGLLFLCREGCIWQGRGSVTADGRTLVFAGGFRTQAGYPAPQSLAGRYALVLPEGTSPPRIAVFPNAAAPAATGSRMVELTSPDVMRTFEVDEPNQARRLERKSVPLWRGVSH